MPNNQAPQTVAQSWGTFSSLVFGPNPPSPIQYQEMRRAFYAGVHTMLINSAEASTLGDSAGMAYFDSIHKECVEFAAEIQRGFA